MPELPVVRYMIPCIDYLSSENENLLTNIIGLMTTLRPSIEPRYPYSPAHLCVFLVLSDGPMYGECKVVCHVARSGRPIFESPKRIVTAPPERNQSYGIGFRIKGCKFPDSGLYSLRFWFDGEILEERQVRVK